MANFEFIYQFNFFTAELALFVGAMMMLVFGAYTVQDSAIKIARSAVYLFAGVIVLIIMGPFQSQVMFNDSYFVSDANYFTKILISLGALFTILLYLGEVTSRRVEGKFEVPILITLSVLGMVVLVSANNFLVLYLGLEMVSLPSYILAASDRENSKSGEAGLKYFVLGAVASGLILYGISLIYGYLGTVNFDGLAAHELLVSTQIPLGALVGIIMVLCGFFFKVSAAPFHMWTPDVYQGSPTVVTAFFAGSPKIAALIILARLLSYPFHPIFMDLRQVIILVSLISMTIGAFGAIRQINIKRLMAYSTIGHVGYILLALASGSLAGNSALMIYLSIYVILTSGVFGLILLMRRNNTYFESIYDLAGVSKSNPYFAFSLGVLMFSLAGIPPLAGFFGKFYVFFAAIKAGLIIPSIFGVVMSVVSAFYYLRIVKIMYFDDLSEKLETSSNKYIFIVIFVSVLFNLLFALPIGDLVNFSNLTSISFFNGR